MSASFAQGEVVAFLVQDRAAAHVDEGIRRELSEPLRPGTSEGIKDPIVVARAVNLHGGA
jgi:hypothetical protein